MGDLVNGKTVAVPASALQVIVLGSGGGPIENNTTAFLVRSTAVGWTRGCLLAVDAGVHLSAIAKILETHPSNYAEDSPPKEVTLANGPFEGMVTPYASVSANAAYVTRNLVDSYLITHPHLDHISGFVVNTASLPGARPKRLAALPSTIEAFKNHIFNNVIWPNLSNENNGAGLVTYMRLVEGGSLALGDGEGRGYVEICEGLSVKTWGVSHGHCIENHSHRGSSISPGADLSPRLNTSISMQRSGSGASLQIPGEPRRNDTYAYDNFCVYDSCAYFIRDIATGQETLIFGDVEPDSISLSPRNRRIWSEAAPKIAKGHLRGIFIECSYDDSQSDDTLFGHLAPRHLIEEMKVLAEEVQAYMAKEEEKEKVTQRDKDTKKRKRILGSPDLDETRRRSLRGSLDESSPVSPLTGPSVRIKHGDGSANEGLQIPTRTRNQSLPLKDLKVIIIHVKEKLNDGPPMGDNILRQMRAYEEEAQTGCEFVISYAGQTLYL